MNKVSDEVDDPQELLNLFCRQIVIREVEQLLSDVGIRIVIAMRKVHSEEINLGLSHVTFLKGEHMGICNLEKLSQKFLMGFLTVGE